MSEVQKKQIRTSEVLQLLKDGKTRADIAEHYGLTKADTKRLFLHPTLKNRKTIKKRELPFDVVDDAVEEVEVQEPQLGNSPEPQSDVEEGLTFNEDPTFNEGPGNLE